MVCLKEANVQHMVPWNSDRLNLACLGRGEGVQSLALLAYVKVALEGSDEIVCLEDWTSILLGFENEIYVESAYLDFLTKAI